MTERRPRIHQAARAPLTTEQQVAGLQRTTADQAQQIVVIAETVEGLPPTDSIWTDSRPDSGFGTGAEPEWTATGDGSTTTVPVAGRISTSPARYRVTVGGVLQSPSAYTLPTGAATLVFAEAPPAGVAVRIVAPFYGSAS